MAHSSESITIEVVYAPLGANATVFRRVLERQTPYTVYEALRESGVLLQFPEINLAKSHKVGIFAKLVSDHTLLKHQDRLEIYRPLAQDPKILRINKAGARRKNEQQPHKSNDHINR